jgi:IS5 family transposase
LKINKRLIQNANFIHLDAGHAKADKPRRDEAKIWRSIIYKLDKKS